ncbi:hypothetical protein J4760_04010 [Salinicoccus sp. ID82-1]|uniref:hypothetical protein n=1 Tax=Salinicoccus sp. ID82-1 TaxID=2820269 RepID=UPI001F450A81|nr:hypothetical protein [Salinicoccus sp. ID82-1]MCG1009216.1 hypothetical protein [Salinicoccus sp. ID82-1]
MLGTHTDYFIAQRNKTAGDMRAVTVYDNLNVNFSDEDRVKVYEAAELSTAQQLIEPLNMIARITGSNYEFVVVKRTLDKTELLEDELGDEIESEVPTDETQDDTTGPTE